MVMAGYAAQFCTAALPYGPAKLPATMLFHAVIDTPFAEIPRDKVKSGVWLT
jgi:hypothetical protein